MRLALIGYGSMGRLVAARARDARDAHDEGYEIALTFTSKDAARSAVELAEDLRGLDAAIDFSVAGAVRRNAEACARARVPLVVGTTGWHAQEEDVRRLVEEHNGALVYGANFSIGVNVFYRIIERAAEMLHRFDEYAPFVEEAHHSRKRDAPSGTALRLRETLVERMGRDVPVASTRAGHIPGTHRVGFDSAADQILLIHTARTREGFAAGALQAARWIVGRQGVFEFSEVIEEILKPSDE